MKVKEENMESTIEKVDTLTEDQIKNTSSDELTLQLFSTVDKFKDLKQEWSRLAYKADVPIYSTHEWLLCWWKHFGQHPKRALFIMGVFSNKQLVGIAPLFMGRSAIGPVNIHKRLHMMGAGTGRQELLGFYDEYGRSDFLDFIVDPSFEDTVARRLIRFLLDPELKIDTLALQHIRDNGFVKRKIVPLLEQSDVDHELEEKDICPYISLEDVDTMEEYLDELSSNTRRRLRQTLRAIDEEDGYTVEEVETRDNLQDEMEKLRNMHQSRWNTFGYPGAFFDKRFVHFLDEITEKVFDKGWVWFKQAIDEGGYAATRLTLHFNGRFYDYMSGFDASCPSSKYRPGIGLLTIMIKEAIEEDSADIVELLRGDEHYKFDLTSKVRKNWRLEVPLRSQRNVFRKILSKFIKAGAFIHGLISREWTLVKVQQHLKGTPMMFINYVKTRYSMLKYKYRND